MSQTDKKGKLTDKQKMFVIEYTKDFNATRAALSAGYSKRSAQQIATENLSKPLIQQEIKAYLDKIEEKASIDKQYVLDTLVEITERCMQRVPVMEFNKEDKCYKQVVDEETGQGMWTFNANGANKAIENIGRHLGMFHDNLNAKIESEEINKLLSQGRKRVNGGGEE